MRKCVYKYLLPSGEKPLLEPRNSNVHRVVNTVQALDRCLLIEQQITINTLKTMIDSQTFDAKMICDVVRGLRQCDVYLNAMLDVSRLSQDLMVTHVPEFVEYVAQAARLPTPGESALRVLGNWALQMQVDDLKTPYQRLAPAASIPSNCQ